MSVMIYAIAVGSYNFHYVGLEEMRWTKDQVAQECWLPEEDDDNPGRKFNLWGFLLASDKFAVIWH